MTTHPYDEATKSFIRDMTCDMHIYSSDDSKYMRLCWLGDDEGDEEIWNYIWAYELINIPTGQPVARGIVDGCYYLHQLVTDQDMTVFNSQVVWRADAFV